jgi:hypothetical protein
MRENLPVVDYGRTTPRAPIQRCPTGAIVWLDPGGVVVKGPAAKRIVRKGALELRRRESARPPSTARPHASRAALASNGGSPCRF